MTRAMVALEASQFDQALDDIVIVLDNPRLVDYLRDEQVLIGRLGEPRRQSLVEILQIVSQICCEFGRITEGQTIARRALELAVAIDLPTGESHYILARSLVAGHADQGKTATAADQLSRAFVAHPGLKDRYAHDQAFDIARAGIAELLAKKPAAVAQYKTAARLP